MRTEISAPTAMLEGTLRPYPTDSSTPVLLSTGVTTATPTLTPTVTPTPTQVLYDVQSGDDMYSIAFRYGIEPDVLMTANPTVNPGLMPVGTILLIPITPMPEATATATVELSPTITQPYADMLEPDCFPDAIGGLWCFALFKNDENGALENVSGWVELRSGESVRQEIASMPLNLLPAGESLPLIAYFQPPIPENFEITAQVDFLLPVMPDDDRYLPVEIAEQSITMRDENTVAKVNGELYLPEGQPDAEYVWLSAVAFDDEGRVVAVRRWESGGTISAGDRVSFELYLYSMADAIDQVDLLAEAHHNQPEVDEN